MRKEIAAWGLTTAVLGTALFTRRSAHAGTPPVVTIAAPAAGMLAGDSVYLNVNVSSSIDLKGVASAASGVAGTVPLKYSAFPIMWFGNASLVGAPFGNVTITVTATDLPTPQEPLQSP
ncbi:MAG: hypothetical protein NVS3B20_07580 [Polyangiales bacterium]